MQGTKIQRSNTKTLFWHAFKNLHRIATPAVSVKIVSESVNYRGTQHLLSTSSFTFDFILGQDKRTGSHHFLPCTGTGMLTILSKLFLFDKF
jgi:hypothetical protein